MRRHQTIITATTLAEHIDDPQLALIDCRFSLGDPLQGKRAYDQAHLPGALYANLDDDLAGPVTASSGRHPLPDPDEFVQTLRNWGVSNDTQVVVYDDAGGAIAARLWWLLRWLGHDGVAALDGGVAAWQAAGLPLSQEIPQTTVGTFTGRPHADRVIEIEQLSGALADDAGFALVDARAAARFRGEVEPIDPIAGHVPGAKNLPFDTGLQADGRWRSAEELRQLWQPLLENAGDEWSVMCGSGVTACHLALSAAICGLPEPRLYVGSWSEWLKDPARGVAGVD